ncbi:MAG: amidohydrolase [Candidatus Stahlbacteria bacterium]|nr:amidohydrolase [Candidatus Stahlbacteria bacterium]
MVEAKPPNAFGNKLQSRSGGADRLLLTNASLINDPRNTVLVEDGKIKSIGYSRDYHTIKTNSANLTIIDLHNNWLLPGFIDSHIHIVEAGLAENELDLSRATTIDEILSIISNNLKSRGDSDHRTIRPSDHIVKARGFSPHRLKEQRYPTLMELNKISSNIGIIIRREDFHSGVFNSKAMEILNINSDIGILKDRIYETAQKRLRKLITVQEYKDACFKIDELAVRNGVTTITGIFKDIEEYNAFLEIQDKLQITIIPFIQTVEVERIKELGLPRIGGCLLIDGSVSSGTAAFFEPYQDEPENSGTLYWKDDELLKFINLCQGLEAMPLQIAMHAIGDKAVHQLASAYSKIHKNRHLIEHGELIRDEDFRIIKQNELIISAQPSFETYFAEVYEQKLGKKRALRMNPFRKIIDNGIHLAFGSDAPITPIDPIKGIESAINHPNPALRITREEAIRCFTYEGAYTYFLENEVGSIKEGLNADLISLSADFSSVNLVIKQGKLIFNT